MFARKVACRIGLGLALGAAILAVVPRQAQAWPVSVEGIRLLEGSGKGKKPPPPKKVTTPPKRPSSWDVF